MQHYVGSGTLEPGSDRPTAFAAQARMITVAGPEHAGKGWRTERRHVLEHFRQQH